jgi:hypothetical protein
MASTPIATFGRKMVVPYEHADQAKTEVVQLATGTYAAGRVLGEITATPGTYGSYADANVDGTGVARLILAYAYIANADGTVNPGNSASGEWGQTERGAICYRSGCFKTTDLVGLDAAAIADLGGHLVRGTVADGLVVIPGE